jgi:hypothetical protein
MADLKSGETGICKSPIRDDTLLTVCFSIRTKYPPPLPSPAGTALDIHIPVAAASIVPAGLLIILMLSVRMLKHTVNKVPSFKDFLRMRQFDHRIANSMRPDIVGVTLVVTRFSRPSQRKHVSIFITNICKTI